MNNVNANGLCTGPCGLAQSCTPITTAPLSHILSTSKPYAPLKKRQNLTRRTSTSLRTYARESPTPRKIYEQTCGGLCGSHMGRQARATNQRSSRTTWFAATRLSPRDAALRLTRKMLQEGLDWKFRTAASRAVTVIDPSKRAYSSLHPRRPHSLFCRGAMQ
jgi:hypothetical protein